MANAQAQAAEEEERRMRLYAGAFSRQAKSVRYDDYKPSEDFTLWLNGFREKIRNEYGFNATQDAEVNAEILRSISSKLTRGTALNAYNRLTADVKGDYTQLIDALTKEFTDPQEKTRFQECFGYNVRRKGQSIKDFAEDIKLSQDKYSDMKDTITIGNQSTPNTAKIRDGIRRFKKGLRGRDGKINVEQRRHLRYNLQNDDDLTWEHAINVASRWEAANEFDEDGDDDDDDEDDDAVDAMETSKTKEKNGKKKRSTIMSAVEFEENTVAIASLTAKVETNTREIKGIKSEQERLSANVQTQLEEMNSTLKSMNSALNNPAGAPRGMTFQRGGYPGFVRQPRNYNSPMTYTWKGGFNQSKQTGFGMRGRSPATFAKATPAQPTTSTTVATAPRMAAPTVAAVEIDPSAQPLGAEAEAGVYLSMDQFLELRGDDYTDDELVGALDNMNFY